MYMTKLADGRTVNRIELQKGFDWLESVSPKLPECPKWLISEFKIVVIQNNFSTYFVAQ